MRGSDEALCSNIKPTEWIFHPTVAFSLPVYTAASMLRVLVLASALLVSVALAMQCTDGEACMWLAENGGEYEMGVCIIDSCVRGSLLCDDRNSCTEDSYNVQDHVCEHVALPDGVDDGVNYYCLNGRLMRPDPVIPECHSIRIGDSSWLFPALENDTPCITEEEEDGMCFDGVCYPYEYENECPPGKCFDAEPDQFGGCELHFLPTGVPCRNYITPGWGTGEPMEDGSHCGIAGQCVGPEE